MKYNNVAGAKVADLPKDVEKSFKSKCLTRTYKKQVILHEL